MMTTRRLLLLLLGIGFSVLMWVPQAAATPYDCNICDGGGILLPEVCHWADLGESGTEDCNDTAGCRLFGDACEGDANGGGGGGGDDGGDECTSWNCDISCMSCSPPAT